ncbi:MAG TPA: DUF1127 domain-containing protein, partial [Rubellimicrobium sp.]|nr:DUF1127 domain-containing protein [Rubellimicrobium sp.]
RRGRPGLLGRFVAIMALRRSRRRLCDLDDYMLRDIGLTRTQARSEATRPVWDVPAHWLR